MAIPMPAPTSYTYLCLYLPMPIPTYGYTFLCLYLPMPIQPIPIPTGYLQLIPIHLPTPTYGYTYLCLPMPTYTYLLLPIPTYCYRLFLYLPIPTYCDPDSRICSVYHILIHHSGTLKPINEYTESFCTLFQLVSRVLVQNLQFAVLINYAVTKL